MKVLIVDDAAFMRMTLRKILESAGHEVVGEAIDGDDAIVKFLQYKPDLVTMDITMPNKNGIEATRAIRAIDANAKILMTSAMGQESMVREAILAGAFDFIVKPVDGPRFLNAIDKIVSKAV